MNAKEANALYYKVKKEKEENLIKNLDKIEYSSIIKLIKNQCEKGNYNLYIPSISEGVMLKLKEKGYQVTYFYNSDNECKRYLIGW